MNIQTQLIIADEILKIFEKHSITKIEGIAILEVIKYGLLAGK